MAQAMKIAIVDDEQDMRQSISQWLALSGFDTETFASAEDALKASEGGPPPSLTDKSGFHILFAGNMGKAQALDAVLETARILQARAPNLAFVFLGGGVEVDHLKEVSEDAGLSNVTFLPPVPMSEVGKYLSAADVLLVHLKQDPLFRITIPSKTQAYMAVGKPILMAVDGDAADLVMQSAGGRIACSEEPESIADAALALAQTSEEERSAMAERNKRFYREKLSLVVGVRRFAKLFNQLAARS